jgi:hypothetical protein
MTNQHHKLWINRDVRKGMQTNVCIVRMYLGKKRGEKKRRRDICSNRYSHLSVQLDHTLHTKGMPSSFDQLQGHSHEWECHVPVAVALQKTLPISIASSASGEEELILTDAYLRFSACN